MSETGDRIVHRRPGTIARRALRALPVVAGWLTLVVVVDVLAGLALGRSGEPERTSLILDGLTTTTVEGADGSDPRASTPAYADAPWAADYWDQFNSLQYDYEPFLPGYQRDSQLPYINVTDGIRRSYEPAGLSDDDPVIWFFGGSTMFGEGQRDLHTIPSQVARTAEDRGVGLRVVNHGQRGWTHWQEMLAFERALAGGPAPDLVVFYDGSNEINTHLPELGGVPSEDPTFYDFGGLDPEVVPSPFSAGAEPDPEPDDADWYDDLVERSVLLELLGDLTGWTDPAGADESEGADAEVVRRAVDIYERGQAVSQGLADRAGTTPLFFWQPQQWPPLPELDTTAREYTLELLGPSTTDLTGALDGVEEDDVYIDGAHTNELGARLVAEAMLPHLLDALGA